MVPGDCNDIMFNVRLNHSPQKAVNTKYFLYMVVAQSDMKPALYLGLKIIRDRF